MAPQVGQGIAVGIGGGAREGHLSLLVDCLILSGIDCWRRVDQDERLVGRICYADAGQIKDCSPVYVKLRGRQAADGGHLEGDKRYGQCIA